MPLSKKSGMFKLFVDGASRGNPGPAAAGAVLYDGSNIKVSEVSRYLGDLTNNAAEYLALIYGLQEALLHGAGKIQVRTDSQLVARQLKGMYKVKSGSVRVFYDITSGMIRFFERFDIDEIPREKNREADLLANKALDKIVLF